MGGGGGGGMYSLYCQYGPVPSLRVWFSVQFGLEREFTFCSRSLQKGAVFSNRLHVGCKRFS